MYITGNLLSSLEPLSAYGEYTEEVVAKAEQKLWRPQNHLSGSLSPYLMLHASDPVGWFTWGPDAFRTARALDRPLMVNIGFYSEHWCRVMERECFSDGEVAGMINDICIPICVDREERPDINDIFMEACMLQNGSAGWPLNIFLTPEGRPFFCTTWLPKRTMGHLPGITEIIPRVKWLWRVQRSDVEREAQGLAVLLNDRLSELAGTRRRGRVKGLAYEAVNDLRRIFDVRWGGFGGPQKFPEASKLLFLFTQAGNNSSLSKHDKNDALTMTDITLRRMWRGGIHDHLGGGFSRYASDERWLVPHFEKLLTDQALLLYAVSLAQQLQNNSFHRMFAEDIMSCMVKYFALDEAYSQAFRSSICGDTSIGEGRYYLWTEDEIKRALPEGDAALFCAAYGVLPSGNFGSELGGAQIAQNILYEASTVTDLAKRYGLRAVEVASRLQTSRNLLLAYRDNRYPLNADNKVIMGANGLMIAALSRASTAFDCTDWRDIAERTALFLQKSLRDKEGKYHRIWLDGKLCAPALAEDYAYFLLGIVELYKAAKHFNAGEKQLSDWLKCAQDIADTMIAEYWDNERGGFVLSDKNDVCLWTSMKAAQDMYALPNANAVAAIVFTELGIILEDKKYTDYARKTIDCFSGYVRANPVNALTMISADMLYRPVKVKPITPQPVPTDEELNAPIQPDIEAPSQPKPARPESSARQAASTQRASRSERRRRTSRTRER